MKMSSRVERAQRIVAIAVVAFTGLAYAQEQDPPHREGGPRGGPQRGQSDPAQMQEMRLQRLQRVLAIEDAEWEAVAPLLAKVVQAQGRSRMDRMPPGRRGDSQGGRDGMRQGRPPRNGGGDFQGRSPRGGRDQARQGRPPRDSGGGDFQGRAPRDGRDGMRQGPPPRHGGGGDFQGGPPRGGRDEARQGRPPRDGGGREFQDRPSREAGGARPGGPGRGGFRRSPPGPEAVALNEALAAEDSSPDQIRAKMDAARAARAQRELKLKQVREELRELLTVRQEARLFSMGLLD